MSNRGKAISGKTTERSRMYYGEEISAYVYDKRKTKNRGRPTIHAGYGGPTPQMRAKAKRAEGIEQLPTVPGHDPAHQIRSPVEASKEHLTENERATAFQIISAIEKAGTVNVTANYDGVPVQAYGARHGGVPDPCREAHHLVELIKSRIDPQFWDIVEFMAGEVRLALAGKPTSIEDLGRKLTAYKGKDTARAAGVAAIKMTLIRVEEEIRRERALDRKEEPISEVRKRLLLRSERESLADARKRVFSRSKIDG